MYTQAHVFTHLHLNTHTNTHIHGYIQIHVHKRIFGDKCARLKQVADHSLRKFQAIFNYVKNNL